MHQPEEAGRDRRGGGVCVTKIRWPTNAHQQQRQDRRGGHYYYHQPLAKQVPEERLLQTKVGHQYIREVLSAAGYHGDHRQQQIER